jgi:polysaccharide deacetylase 2 family uncharacterized protein YibQ
MNELFIGGECMKRLFVVSLGPVHFIIAAVVVLAAGALILWWPGIAHSGEGGFAKTLSTNSGVAQAAADPNPVSSGKGGKLAIIIDDFGQGREGVKQMMSIDRHLTFAVMPFSTFTKQDADDGFEKGYEIIVHLPMEPMQGPPDWVGTNPILCSQSDEKITSITRQSLEDVPHAVGANVHMGSKASADDRVMHCILTEVHSAGFFFVDSRTGQKSVIPAVAQELNVPCLERNVFLDGHTTESYTVGQLRLAAKLALKNGYAIAIGHVGLEGGKPTAQAIVDMLDEFDREGVQLVFVSELFGQSVTPGAAAKQ